MQLPATIQWPGCLGGRVPMRERRRPAGLAASMLRVLRLGMLGAAVFAATLPASRPADAAQTQFTNSGGTVSINPANDLVVTGSSLDSPAGLVSMVCPLTSIPPTSPYALE